MASLDEKQFYSHLEAGQSDSSSNDDVFTPHEQSKIRHKIDRRLIPALGLCYAVSLMDRKNISNAAIAGMRTDLDLLTGYKYSFITLVFFLTYVIFQPPMTVLCRKIGPKLFLPGICLLWGVVIIGFGFAENWQTLVALRLILGILEAGYFPGCVYLLSTWYTRYQVAKRYSVFYLIGMMGSAMSGILAYGLMQMEGVAGIRGWRWIFIMEGIITCAIAIFAYLFIVKFPDQELKKQSFWFLKQDECKYIVDTIEKDRGDVEAEPFSLARFLKPARDIEIWGFAFIFFLLTTVTYSFAFFLPIILRDNMGFSVAASQCLVAPPYVLAAVLMYVTSWAGDKYRVRAVILVGNSVISIIGLPIMAFASGSGVKYFGVFIAVAGVNANIPACMAYQANNIRGQWKRAFCSASLVGFGGIGGIAGSLVFRSQDSPRYIPGTIATMVCCCLVAVVCGPMTLYFRHRNKLADEGKLVIDDDPNFRYTI